MPDFQSTPQANDLIAVDRKTLKMLQVAIVHCCDSLAGIRVNEIFVQAAVLFLDCELNSKIDEETEVASKIDTILRVWTDLVPELCEELQDDLREVRESISSILSISKNDG